MTSRKELEALISKLRSRGASVEVRHDSEGHINTVAVSGVKGIGPFPMSPISFAEKARAV